MEALANCRLQALMDGKKRVWGRYWQAWRVATARSTLVSVLTLLVGGFVYPQSHLRNGSTYWSRCSMEDLANCICQAPVGDSKVLLRSSW